MNLKNLNVKIHKSIDNNLKNKKIKKIYKIFENSLRINSNFIVALSGGADSLALSYLAKIYSIKNSLNVKFFIVDHKLRNESTLEANTVKKILAKFNIKVEILTWRGIKPKKNIQSLARKKRYELLLSKCEKLGVNNLLFAHHQNDLFENFFIRILRGSGLRGLVSFNKASKIRNINILRPLLDLNKKDLVFISKFIFNFCVKDPSNYDNKFLRVRVRNLLTELEKEGLDNKKLFNTLKNLQSTDSAIKFFVNKNLEENSFFYLKKNQSILSMDFFHQPNEIVFRSFSNVLKMISKNYYHVRGKKLDKIILQIREKNFSKATLGGCVIKKVNKSVIIAKEHKI